MSVIFFLIPLSIVVAAGFLAAFIWAVRSGQFEDTCTPSMRLLLEERAVGAPGAPAPARSAAAGEPAAAPRELEAQPGPDRISSLTQHSKPKPFEG